MPAATARAAAVAADAGRAGWMQRLRQGLRKTSTGITQVFTGVRIDEALYEELETALLLADTGLPATEYLLTDLRRRVKDSKATDPAPVKGLLVEAIADLLKPLERAARGGPRIADGDHGGGRQRCRQDHQHRQAHALAGAG